MSKGRRKTNEPQDPTPAPHADPAGGAPSDAPPARTLPPATPDPRQPGGEDDVEPEVRDDEGAPTVVEPAKPLASKPVASPPAAAKKKKAKKKRARGFLAQLDRLVFG